MEGGEGRRVQRESERRKMRCRVDVDEGWREGGGDKRCVGEKREEKLACGGELLHCEVGIIRLYLGLLTY